MTEQMVKQFIEDNAFLEKDKEVRVKEVWPNRFRVNVWQRDPKTVISSSYFIKTNDSGVISCNPPLGA